MISVFYDERMVADSGGYSPSARKPEDVVRDWGRNSLPVSREAFKPLSIGDMACAHSLSLVRDVLALRRDNGHGNSNADVAATFPWTTGSHLAASLHALDAGVACSPTSGFHHAHYSFPQGFCTFNGLMISAVKLLESGKAKRIGIVDYDEHYGNGTDDIVGKLGLESSIGHINANSYANGDEFIGAIHGDMDSMGDVDLVMYQAGADQHIDDPLGGLLTTEQMRERDRLVFQWCKERSVPVVFNLAGGYQREADGSIPVVLEIHRNTMLECISAFRAPCIV